MLSCLQAVPERVEEKPRAKKYFVWRKNPYLFLLDYNFLQPNYDFERWILFVEFLSEKYFAFLAIFNIFL
jgi:hypothetical protein